jgi:hypothetical protein
VRAFVESFAELGNRRFSVVERGRECSQDENVRNKQNELFPKTNNVTRDQKKRCLVLAPKEFLEY